MIPILILAMSAIVHFIQFGKPASVVFDEVFYGNFASSYWQGSYFFDLHPPFVKLLFAFVGKIFHLDQFIVDWSSIGNSIPLSIVGLRVLPIVAGLILPLIIYAICRHLNFSKLASSVASILIVLENSLIVQSRFILPDIIMLVFGFTAILLYFEYNKRFLSPYRSWFFILSTIFAGIALSIKWTGLTFLFLIVLMEIISLYHDSTKFILIIKKTSVFVFKYLLISLIIYLSLFAIHFAVLPNSGKGDPFMSQKFQKTLIGNINSNDDTLPSISFWEKFTELNRVMFTSNSHMTAGHPYSSKWYTWPFMQRSIFYWQSDASNSLDQKSYIYLLGNPFVYWLGTLSVFTLILISILKLITKKTLSNSKIILFLIIGYLINLLPFALIGRVMFLYHYETALVFSIISIAFIVDYIRPTKKLALSFLIIFIAFSAFIYWSPLTYGIPISNEKLESLMWFPSWR